VADPKQRIRTAATDPSVRNGVSFGSSSIRQRRALNAVQVAERLVRVSH
jgi:hypothetical protein